ncbi:MAG: hypothetical protein HQK57_07155 [Deltaproteobacteria bacterium]|nr:hypothetical protein [Deltaproteobacteria bacterium]
MKEYQTREVAFFGKITAGITHEFKNVLAIIKESAGLMEDFLLLSPTDSFPYRQKFVDTMGIIKEQVGRGNALVAGLNQFAHSADQSRAEINLNDMMAQLVLVSARFTRLNGVTLKFRSFDRPVPLTTDPMRLEMTVFAGIESCLAYLSTGDTISVCPGWAGDRVIIEIICECTASGQAGVIRTLPASQDWAGLQTMAADLNGTVESKEAPAGLVFTFPRQG